MKKPQQEGATVNKDTGNLVINMTQEGYVLIGGIVKISIAEIHGKQIKVRIEAPREVKVLRSKYIDNISATPETKLTTERKTR